MPNIITLEGRVGSYELFKDILALIIGGGMSAKTLIDLCCNEAPITSQLPFRDKVYVDIEPRTIPEQHRFIQADVLGDHPAVNTHYDVSTCLDGIEHLPKEDGWRLIEKTKSISDKRVFFTPLGEWMVEARESARWTDPTSHKCGWLPEDLPDFAHIVLPNYHPTLGIGAFFFWHTDNLNDDFLRVEKAISNLA